MDLFDPSFLVRVAVRELDLAVTPGALLDGLLAAEGPSLLESTAADERLGRYGIFACMPLEVLVLRDGVLTDSRGRRLAEGRDAWRSLEAAFACVRAERPAGAAYAPGWIGYVGYEVGRLVERLPGRAARDTVLPDLRLAFHDAVLVHDALAGTWTLSELVFDGPRPDGAGRAAERLLAIAAEARTDGDRPGGSVAGDAGTISTTGARHGAADNRTAAADVRSNFSPDAYRRAVARCVEHIAAGDAFQICLTQRFAVPDAPPAEAIYRVLRRRNPAWYAAYLGFESRGRPCAVASSSPELFLRVRDGRVVTRPIKGTRRRTGDPAADEAARADLLASEKDNAELAMIIDLLRNDLGRVCRYGTVRVSEPRRLEAHPTVFHLVGTVEGALCEGVGPAALLRATFPGGSITGAPKIRAMEIIDDIERLARGVYTGCIGWVGVDGSCEWNIAIRTVVHDGRTAYVGAGGGVVADSTPDAEYDETLDKARALLEAVDQAAGRWVAGNPPA